jgi:RNA polymerase sigma-70 factor, ECF subfamily
VPVLVRDQVLTQLRERIVAFAASRYTREFAEDLAQEVLLVIHEKYSSVERLEELFPLALQIVRFKISALHRKSLRRGEYRSAPVAELPLPDSRPNPEEETARRELLSRLKAALAEVGERCRELMRLKLEERSFDEIRVHFGVNSINTIYTWDLRCRKAIAEKMARQERPR